MTWHVPCLPIQIHKCARAPFACCGNARIQNSSRYILICLNNDEDVEVRAAAANALGQFVYLGELEKIPAELHHKIEDELLEATTASNEKLIRRRALESLGYSGREEVDSADRSSIP